MSLIAERNAGSKANSMPSRLRFLFVCATVLGGGFLLMTISNISQIDVENHLTFLSWEQIVYKGSKASERFLIKTEGCSIPFLKPFEDEIKKYVEYPTKHQMCPNPVDAYLNNNLTHIWVIHENKEIYNISEEDDVQCCYQSFYRPVSIDDITSKHNDNRVKYKKCKYFNDSIEARDEFVRVYCKNNKTAIYKQYYMFPHMKQIPEQHKHNKTGYNVIVMGIDALSRLNFHRTMPKTIAFLKNKGAIELLGYNKVGDNTFPNLVPILMGISDQELKSTCVPSQGSSFDNCPFVWYRFKEEGYATAFGEDSSSLGTFNFFKSGFVGYPTDYYIHTFINEAERNVGTVKDFNSYLCMNDIYFYELLLSYVTNLSMTLFSKLLFGFFWEVTMTHDYLNYPMLIDDNYVRFFKNLDELKYLDKTIFLLVSDHGIRWGGIRSTKQGRLEERLPFVYILLPPEFQTKYKDAYINLKTNSKRLTTPYDLHATLVDLVDLKQIENENIQRRKSMHYTQNRSISLFLPIPTNRTCSMAHIDDHWCTCHRSRGVSLYSKEARETANELVNKLNMLLEIYEQCAQLAIRQILEVSEIYFGGPAIEEQGWTEYLVVIRTTPGYGIFEATMRRYDGNWTLEGTVSRLNLYGKQSHCMHNDFLKLYCYCQ